MAKTAILLRIRHAGSNLHVIVIFHASVKLTIHPLLTGSSEKYRNFVEDPWIESGTAINTPVPNDGHTKILILGAGFGGILFAVRLLQAGVKRDDIVIVDPAGGFGGTCKCGSLIP